MFSKQLFAERVIELRKLHHETQGDLGAVLGVRQTAICEMERGRKTTTSEKIAKICRHYNVSADYLLGLSDDPAGGRERWEEEP